MSTTDPTITTVVLFEKDTNGDILPTWSYPKIEYPELEDIIKSRSLLSTTRLPSFSKYKDRWIYIASGDGDIPRVEHFSVALITTEFNPEKYSSLCKHLTNLYKNSKSPIKLLECYLDVLTTMKHDAGAGLGSFDGAPWNASKDHLLASPLLDIVKMFEDRSWLIWSALMMKKRIVVYSDQLEQLLKFVRALPLFVLHRQDWSLLRPFVTLDNTEEIEDLTKAGVYVAGFTSPQIKQRDDLYDLFIDVYNINIEIPAHAQDDFVQTQYHQDFGSFFLKALEAEGVTDQKLIKSIRAKTSDLISKLQKLKAVPEGETEAYVSIASLRAGNLPPNFESFLYSVAAAEGLTKVSKQ